MCTCRVYSHIIMGVIIFRDRETATPETYFCVRKRRRGWITVAAAQRDRVSS